MDLAGKLQLKPGETLCVLNAPKEFRWDGLSTKVPADADAVLCFLRSAADLTLAGPALEAARADRLAWVAFPKEGKLGTDLDKERVVALVKPEGVASVRVVSVDDTWAAARLRPAK